MTAGRSALIVNTRSRQGGRAFFRSLDLLHELGVGVEVTYPLRDPARLVEATASALSQGCGLLILGGGDGSVSAVVNLLAGSHVTLGLLPLGTANDFARTLKIPFELEQACATIARGKVVDVDLGMAGENYYVNVASMGLGAEVVRAVSPHLKRTIGPAAYPAAAARAFLRARPFDATLSFPARDHPTVTLHRLVQLAAGNGRFYGGGMVVAPEAGIDDRCLDLYAVEARSRLSLLRLIPRLRSGELVHSRGVHHYRTALVHIETTPALPVNLDGEVVAHTPETFRVAPNALRVLVPESSDAARDDGAPVGTDVLSDRAQDGGQVD